jgi:hypothetical protein
LHRVLIANERSKAAAALVDVIVQRRIGFVKDAHFGCDVTGFEILMLDDFELFFEMMFWMRNK